MSILPSATSAVPSSAARLPPLQARQQLALDALAGQAVSALAERHQVSRKFVYQQLGHRRDALEQAFAATPGPIRKSSCSTYLSPMPGFGKSSLSSPSSATVPFAASRVLRRDLFDYPLLRWATVHNIVQPAVPVRPGSINANQDLAAVRIGADDEIFQAGHPILVGDTRIDLLLSSESREALRWRHLGRATARTEANVTLIRMRPSRMFAGGLRAGHEPSPTRSALPWRCLPLFVEVRPLVRYLENRAYEAITTRSRLEGRQARTEHRQGRKDASLAGQLRYARVAETQAVTLADEVAVLLDWLRQDVLAVRGPDYAGRCGLYDWIVAELQTREAQCPHRIRPVRCLLENHRNELLAFAKQLDNDSPGSGRGLRGSRDGGRRSPPGAELVGERPGALAAGAGVVATLGVKLRGVAGSRDGVAGSGWCVPAV